MSQAAPSRAVAAPDVTAWLARLVRQVAEIHPLPGDVSPRQYARIVFADGGSAILASYPPEVRPTCVRFLRTTELLTAAGVRVPHVLASDCGDGLMLLEDLGPQTLGDWKGRPWSVLRLSFERALDLAGRIARLPVAEVADLNPRLDAALLRRELKQTWDLFLEPRGLTGGPTLTAALGAALDTLCERLGSGPAAPCHRDFMARNLMPLDDQGGVAVLDHQDLRLGPAAYDLASLLNDTLFPPPEIEDELLAAALPELPAEIGRTGYHRAAAQRTLKAVGTYTSFARRGAERHLPLIAPTLSRCLDHLGRLPEGEALVEDLGRLWRPVLDEAAA
jgi:aminoglycoside/choline kinase family phosphotransferase